MTQQHNRVNKVAVLAIAVVLGDSDEIAWA
jgi:hypothetical protein